MFGIKRFIMSKKLCFSKTKEISLADATKPLLVVLRLVGMNPKSNWHKIYTVFILTCEILLICYLWNFHLKRTLRNFYFNALIHALKDVCRTGSILVIFILSFIDGKRFVLPVKEFANIDRNLKSLGGFLDNRGMYRSIILQIGCLGSLLILCELLDLYSQIHSMTNEIPQKIIGLGCSYYMVFNIICSAADYCFAVALSIIRKRFEQINLIIRRSENRGSYLRINFLEDSSEHSENDVSSKLRILRRQYHELWKIAKRVNGAYGPHLLVGAANSLGVITMEIWKTFYLISSNREKNLIILIGNMIWFFFHIARICVLAQVCESTVTEAKSTADALRELEMREDCNPRTKSEIRDFLFQLQFEAQNFTACKFFDINFSLVCGILGAVWTYLIILIQMDNSNCTVVKYANLTSA